MLEHTTLDDFMKGLYSKNRGLTTSVLEEKSKNVMGALMTGMGLDSQDRNQS